MARGYSLNDQQKRQYPHNLLSKNAAYFYSHSVEAHAVTFQLAADMISAQYNSSVRKTQVLDHLESLSLGKLTNTGMDESAALAKLYATIVKMSPQLPTSHRGDAHRMRFMRRTVFSRAWSHRALQRVASQGLSIQEIIRRARVRTASLQGRNHKPQRGTSRNSNEGYRAIVWFCWPESTKAMETIRSRTPQKESRLQSTRYLRVFQLRGKRSHGPRLSPLPQSRPGCPVATRISAEKEGEKLV